MKRMPSIIRFALLPAIAAACALVAATAWVGSSSGLAWVSREIMSRSNNTVRLQGVEGSLLGEVRIAHLGIDGGDYALTAESLALDWQPWALLRGEIRLRRVLASRLRYGGRSSSAPALPQSLALPISISVQALGIRQLEIDGLPAISNLRVEYSGGPERHELRLLETRAADWALDGQIRIDALAPFAVAGQMHARRGPQPGAIQAAATLGGRIEALQLAVTGGGRDAAVRLDALLQPFASLPLARVQASARTLDLAQWHAGLPRTRLDVDLDLQSGDGILGGGLHIGNALSGPLDAGRLPLTTAHARISGKGDDWNLHDLVLQLPGGGRITGHAGLHDGKARADIRLRDIDASRIDSRMRPVRISGDARLAGDRATQHASARLQGAGLKLQFNARHAEQTLTISEGRLEAGGGLAGFRASMGRSGKQPFALEAELKQIDPSRLARLPSASLNGRIAARGNMGPGWQAQIDVALPDSRLRGLPFSAQAAFTTSDRQTFNGKAHAAVGRNRIDIQGRYGLPQDQLAWSVDAADLAAIDPGLGGSLRGGGSVTSGSDGPALVFSVDARQLAAGRHRAARLEARGTLAAGQDGLLEISAKGGGLLLSGVSLDSLQATASGTRSRHRLEASAGGPAAAGLLRASGGIDAQGRWNGSLEHLQAERPWPLRLRSPARITLSRELLAVEDLQASLLDGEFGPASLRMADGRTNSRGTFRNIAIGPLLPREGAIMARDLRLGGQWELEIGDILTGSIGVQRESGDLAVAGETPVALGLRKAALKLGAAEGLVDIALDIDSATMGTATARMQTRPARRDGQWLWPGEAPLNGHADLDLRSLAVLRVLLPGLDRIDGTLALRLQAEGSVAEPRLAGNISGDGILLRAIGPGLDLRDGRLRATLEGSRFRLDTFEIRAGRGRIVAQGDAELAPGLRSINLQARAEHAQILLAPQWSAVIDGSGSLGLRERRVTLDGKFRLDEGRYDLGNRRKPALADDVVVRSPKPENQEKTASLPVHLDVSLDLQDKLAVRGNGLDALLGGSLRVTTRGPALAAFGDVRTVRGNYTVFGQRLDIERGTVTFGGPLADPGLDLRAIRKIQTVEVGVEVTGSLQRPLVRLVSTPDMSDTDRMAWLALGRDPAGTGHAQLAVLQAAVLSLTGSGGKPVHRQLAEGAGLDEIGFASGENGALGVVALGKHLTDQLSIRLEQTLGGTAGSLLRMDYLLSDRWRLRGTAGAENAGDILFTLRFD